MMTVKELVNFCKENNIPLDAKISPMGAFVNFVGYKKSTNIICLDDQDDEWDSFYDIIHRRCDK